jgi:hypothetical protein
VVFCTETWVFVYIASVGIASKIACLAIPRLLTLKHGNPPNERSLGARVPIVNA